MTWPATNDEWVEFVKNAYAAGLIGESVFERKIDRLIEQPDDLTQLTLGLPTPFALERALIYKGDT